MKKIFLLSLLASGLYSQTPPVSTIASISTNPTFDSKGSLLTAPIQTVFMNTVTVDDVSYSSQSQVSWDGTDNKSTVTADGITATYKQVTDLAAAIAVQVKGAQDASAKAAKNVAVKYPRTYLAPDGVNTITDYGNGVMTMTLLNVVQK